MNFKSKFLLALLTAVSYSYVMVADDRDDEQTYESRRRKVCKCCSLVVSGNGSFGGNLTVSGNETVTGSITAGSFARSPLAASTITGAGPGVPGIGGALAWGEVANTTGAAVVGIGPVQMNYASASFSGMQENNTNVAATSGLTITFAGIYLFQYSASYVAGASATTTVTINLISNLGTSPIPGSQFTTESVNPALTSQVGEVSGFVISYIPAGALVQLNTTTGFTTNAAGNVGAKLTATRIA